MLLIASINYLKTYVLETNVNETRMASLIAVLISVTYLATVVTYFHL